MKAKIEGIRFVLGLLAVGVLAAWSCLYLPKWIGLLVFLAMFIGAVFATIYQIVFKKRGMNLRQAWKAVLDIFWGI
ncbi:hypothetical protein [Lysobacter niastensis]|uniref:Uncharacterized protein n=1 Tax=Lysobacter niastensis TaxID=380629 RepID=A0ABS0BB95_9GAMM|nr:hypothetical protein [Lysobacter niastensis]MBF6025162.1 hypothetical protein [Lysobacter niastensis]